MKAERLRNSVQPVDASGPIGSSVPYQTPTHSVHGAPFLHSSTLRSSMGPLSPVWRIPESCSRILRLRGRGRLLEPTDQYRDSESGNSVLRKCAGTRGIGISSCLSARTCKAVGRTPYCPEQGGWPTRVHDRGGDRAFIPSSAFGDRAVLVAAVHERQSNDGRPERTGCPTRTEGFLRRSEDQNGGHC